jgi:ubiquinone/menaquinone biosynthesis C-methylase UbiE
MRRVEHLLRATAQAEARHFWFRGFRAFVTPLIRQATSGQPDARILDCGCGTGANLALLSRFGRACGFDLSEAGLRIGREGGRTRLARASVTAVPFPDATFDLVTSFDVLYSLQTPDELTAVAEMYRLIRPGGYALVNVAALELLRGDHSVLSREVRRYSRPALQALLTRAGFTIERITYTNATLFAPMALLRAAQRMRGLSSESEAQTDISVPPAPINAVLSGLLLLESVWLRRFNAPFGSSLLCLARKPA